MSFKASRSKFQEIFIFSIENFLEFAKNEICMINPALKDGAKQIEVNQSELIRFGYCEPII
ncbi:MAG: hypothetical protein DRJ05_18905 [Bacteroidetes bacterium]|nr:MAG: hypothetical protein DRJ05_18905 [Bacteroidota bacterium]